MRERNVPRPHQPRVQRDDRERLGPDEPPIARVQRFEKGVRRAVDARGHGERRHEKHDDIREINQHPEKPRERAVELHAFPKPALVFKIQIERLVVAAIADVVPDVPLPDEVKRRGKKQREHRADGIVHRVARMQDAVLGLVQHGVGGVHHHAVAEREQRHGPPARRAPCGPQDREHREELRRGDAEIQACRYAMIFHDGEPGGR